MPFLKVLNSYWKQNLVQSCGEMLGFLVKPRQKRKSARLQGRLSSYFLLTILCSFLRSMPATSLRWTMRRQWLRPSGETPSSSRSSGGPPPDRQLPLLTASVARRKMCVWLTSARKQTSPSSTSWRWPSSGPPLRPSPTSARSFCQTGEGKHSLCRCRFCQMF